MDKNKIATKIDIIDYLNSVMLGNSSSSCLVNIKNKSSAYTEEIFKPPIQKERLKASELLSKYYDNFSSLSSPSIIIVDDISTSFDYCKGGDFLLSDTQPISNSNQNLNSVPNNDSDEVLLYLSSVMFGTSVSSVLINVRDDSGSYSQEFQKFPSEDERLKAAEMLGKYYDMFSSSNSNSSPSKLPIVVGKEVL